MLRPVSVSAVERLLLGDAKIGDLHLPLLADDDILRLDIAMHQPDPVRGIQAIGNTFAHIHRCSIGRAPPRMSRALRSLPATYSITM